MPEQKPASPVTKRHRPWRVVWIVVAGLTLLLLIAFVIGVIQRIADIKAGRVDPNQTPEQAVFQASLSKKFADMPSTADASRVEPKEVRPTLGDPNAKLRIVEFLDYQCPYCRETAPAVRSFMARHATDTLLIVRDFPLTDIHPLAEGAAMAADCVFRATPSVYWTYHDRLFASQSAAQPSDLRSYAKQLGVDMAKYDVCISSKAPAQGIQTSLDDGLAAGVRGTPTFFFNGVMIQGARTLSELEAIAAEARKHLTE